MTTLLITTPFRIGIVVLFVAIPILAASCAYASARRREQGILGSTLVGSFGLLLGMMLDVLLLLVAASVQPAPGSGPQAREGFERAAPIIQALGEQHDAGLALPESLDQLVPAHLSLTELDRWRAVGRPGPLGYHRTESSFRLAFQYPQIGGQVLCGFQPESDWHCVGYQ